MKNWIGETGEAASSTGGGHPVWESRGHLVCDVRRFERIGSTSGEPSHTLVASERGADEFDVFVSGRRNGEYIFVAV